MTPYLMDQLTQPLYDTLLCPPGVSRFFAIPVGMGVSLFGSGPAGPIAKHFGDTNAMLSAQLPAGWQFVCRGIYLEVLDLPGHASALPPGAALHLVIGTTRYLDLPASAARTTLTVDGESFRETQRIRELIERVAPAALPMLLGTLPVRFGFTFEKVLTISAVEAFGVELVFHENVEPVPVRVYLNGTLGRAIR